MKRHPTAEAITRHTPRKGRMRAWAKRLAARARRRTEKRDPENAPKRVTRGWDD